MYLHDKKPNPDYKNPLLLDYWMKSVVNEKITKDPNPEKKYTKINNLGKSKLQIKNQKTKNEN